MLLPALGSDTELNVGVGQGLLSSVATPWLILLNQKICLLEKSDCRLLDCTDSASFGQVLH